MVAESGRGLQGSPMPAATRSRQESAECRGRQHSEKKRTGRRRRMRRSAVPRGSSHSRQRVVLWAGWMALSYMVVVTAVSGSGCRATHLAKRATDDRVEPDSQLSHGDCRKALRFMSSRGCRRWSGSAEFCWSESSGSGSPAAWVWFPTVLITRRFWTVCSRSRQAGRTPAAPPVGLLQGQERTCQVL